MPRRKDDSTLTNLPARQWQFARVLVRSIPLAEGLKIDVYRDRKRGYEYILYRPTCRPVTLSRLQVNQLIRKVK